jgi:hypothetical protein
LKLLNTLHDDDGGDDDDDDDDDVLLWYKITSVETGTQFKNELIPQLKESTHCIKLFL